MKIDELISELREKHDFVGNPAGNNYCQECGKFMTNMIGNPNTVGQDCKEREF